MQRFLVLTLLTLLASGAAFGQLASTITWEVRPTNGNDNYGGCFDPAIGIGTDYTQQNAVEYNFTDLVISATTTNVTSVSHSFVVADTGNCIHISAGSGFTTGWYEIHSTSGGIATLDRSAGSAASTGGTWFEGGALKTLGQLNNVIARGNLAWMKAEAVVNITSTISLTNVGAGTGSLAITSLIGYTSTRGDGGQVTIQATSAFNGYMINLGGGSFPGVLFANFILNANNEGPANGVGYIQNNAPQTVEINLTVKNSNWNNGSGFGMNAHSICVRCTVQGDTGNALGAFTLNQFGVRCLYCVAVGNSEPGFVFSGSTSNLDPVCVGCISANNTGASSDGFQIGIDASIQALSNCVAYGNGRDGFRVTNSAGQGTALIFNSISYGNTGFGFNLTNGAALSGYIWGFNNAYGSNTGGNLNNLTAGAGDVTLGSNPFVNAASDNFALSTTGITALGGLGFPGTLNVGGTGNLDIGALQHAVAAGSGPKGFPIVQ